MLLPSPSLLLILLLEGPGVGYRALFRARPASGSVTMATGRKCRCSTWQGCTQPLLWSLREEKTEANPLWNHSLQEYTRRGFYSPVGKRNVLKGARFRFPWKHPTGCGSRPVSGLLWGPPRGEEAVTHISFAKQQLNLSCCLQAGCPGCASQKDRDTQRAPRMRLPALGSEIGTGCL